MSILLPIVGILAATSEWSQRTGLTTFALEPRRQRVVLAKILSSLLTALATLLLSVALSAGVHQLAVSVRGVEPDWSMSWAVLGGVALMIALSLAQGVGFGLALLNTPGAIVAYLVRARRSGASSEGWSAGCATPPPGSTWAPPWSRSCPGP